MRGLKPWHRTRAALASIALLLAGAPLRGREIGDVGLPAITHYAARDCGAHSQNWAIAQDGRGVMYFGNAEGVLEHDGVGWRLIRVSAGTGSRFGFTLPVTPREAPSGDGSAATPPAAGA